MVKILVNFHCILFFLRDIHEERLSLEDFDNEQSNFATKLKNFDKGIKAFEKEYLSKKSLFLKTLHYFLVQEKKFLITLKAEKQINFSKKFDKSPTREQTPEAATESTPEAAAERTKPRNAKTKCKISSLNLREEILNEIKNEEKK